MEVNRGKILFYVFLAWLVYRGIQWFYDFTIQPWLYDDTDLTPQLVQRRVRNAKPFGRLGTISFQDGNDGNNDEFFYPDTSHKIIVELDPTRWYTFTLSDIQGAMTLYEYTEMRERLSTTIRYQTRTYDIASSGDIAIVGQVSDQRQLLVNIFYVIQTYDDLVEFKRKFEWQ